MKVLHVLDYSPPFPGAFADHLAALGRALRERGDDLLVAFPRERPWFSRLEDTARVLVIPAIRRPLRSGFAGKLDRIQGEFHVDLAHLSFSFALPFALACQRSRPCIPVVHHWHNPPRALLSSPASRLALTGSLGRFAAKAAARFTDRRAIDAHAVVSREIADLLLAHGWTRPGKVFHLPNALPNIPTLAQRESGSLSRKGVVIGSVASFRPQKDHQTLLHAFALVLREYPDARLLLAGDGPTRRGAEDLSSRLGLGTAVEFLGSVYDPGPVYRAIDLFVLSTHSEGQGLVLLEAMGHALPVVATDLPVIRETVRDGVDGLLALPGRAEALADALMRLIRDPVQRRELGQSGRARILSDFTVSRWIARLLGLYDGLRARGGSA